MSWLKTWYIIIEDYFFHTSHVLLRTMFHSHDLYRKWHMRSFKKYSLRLAGIYLLEAGYDGHVKNRWYALSKPQQCWQEGLSILFCDTNQHLEHFIAFAVWRVRFDWNMILHKSNMGTEAGSCLSTFLKKMLKRETAPLLHLESC